MKLIIKKLNSVWALYRGEAQLPMYTNPSLDEVKSIGVKISNMLKIELLLEQDNVTTKIVSYES